jgi:hypothetical protein
MNITRYLAAAIRANDLPAYQRERYPAIPDGEIVRFVNEDFSGVDFEQFVMGFFVFENCTILSGKMDSFMTCPGLGTLPETRHVVRETLRAGPVVNDSSTALALRQSPVDNELAERASLRLHVSVTIARDVTPSVTVEDLSSSARAPNLCRFPVKPSGGFHFVLLLECVCMRLLRLI